MFRRPISAGAKEFNIGNWPRYEAEAARTMPSIRLAWRLSRFLTPADGFHEWTDEHKVRLLWLIARRTAALS